MGSNLNKLGLSLGKFSPFPSLISKKLMPMSDLFEEILQVQMPNSLDLSGPNTEGGG